MLCNCNTRPPERRKTSKPFSVQSEISLLPFFDAVLIYLLNYSTHFSQPMIIFRIHLLLVPQGIRLGQSEQTVRQDAPNQIKSLLLSHHHSTSALVSEILKSVLQTVQKKKKKTMSHCMIKSQLYDCFIKATNTIFPFLSQNNSGNIFDSFYTK